jgi:prepilin-type N-terminal cleavage/methylation domain-containing protein
MKMMHSGEKGFTLVELLIVIAIVGIIAAVIIPNVGTFMRMGTVTAANSEAENVQTAALAYYSDHLDWPEHTRATNFSNYIAGTLKAEYHFNDYGFIDGVGNPGYDPLEGGTTSSGYKDIEWQPYLTEGGVASVDLGRWVRIEE